MKFLIPAEVTRHTGLGIVVNREGGKLEGNVFICIAVEKEGRFTVLSIASTYLRCCS